MTEIERPVVCKDIIAYSCGSSDIEGDVVFKDKIYSPEEAPKTLHNPIRAEEIRVGGDVFCSVTKPNTL